jgi:hypothetical protein
MFGHMKTQDCHTKGVTRGYKDGLQPKHSLSLFTFLFFIHLFHVYLASFSGVLFSLASFSS